MKDLINTREYWKLIEALQSSINKNETLQLSDDVKVKIIYMMNNSLTDTNYMISKLLIYGKVNQEILLNFLFYISINTSKLYKLFIEDTDKFCRQFMFNITPNELPKVQDYFEEAEIKSIVTEVDLVKKVNLIQNSSNEKLSALFPKSFKHNFKTNPFVKNNNL